MSNPQYVLKEFSESELKEFNEELQVLVDKHSAHFVARPFVTQDGKLDAQFMAFKKVELIPKDNGTFEVPKTDGNGESTNDKPEAETGENS